MHRDTPLPLTKITLGLVASIICAAVVCAAPDKGAPTPKSTAAAPAKPLTKDQTKAEESKKAFLVAYGVFTHPRCLNCHPNGDIPLQGEDSHIHLQNVTRGEDGKGVFAMKCKNCHQDENVAGRDMPTGSPHWQMPPANRKMVFQGKTPHELAIHFKDNQFTGFKSLQDMLKHVEEEQLVLKGWDPAEGLSKPPISHEEFVAKVKEWIEKGAEIPD